MYIDLLNDPSVSSGNHIRKRNQQYHDQNAYNSRPTYPSDQQDSHTK